MDSLIHCVGIRFQWPRDDGYLPQIVHRTRRCMTSGFPFCTKIRVYFHIKYILIHVASGILKDVIIGRLATLMSIDLLEKKRMYQHYQSYFFFVCKQLSRNNGRPPCYHRDAFGTISNWIIEKLTNFRVTFHFLSFFQQRVNKLY